jgi:hypothetical protein
VTVSPDVASSTNLGGWINHAGVWSPGDRIDWFADDTDTLVHWRESEHGQHIELGIAEINLVGLLGELGSTWSRDGEILLPIGTLYDPFVTRALEPWSFGMYAGGQSILVATPSGVTLAPEGGAHQSIITPSIGLEQPGCIAWEPAFAQDLEWTLLHALALLGRPGGSSSYFRLTTRPLAQSLAGVPADPEARERRRRTSSPGGYLLRRAESTPAATLVGVGAVLPEVVAAADELAGAGIAVDVVCVTSADLLFRALRARRGLRPGGFEILDRLFPRTGRRRSSPSSTATRTRSFLRRAPQPWRRSASTASASPATSTTSIARSASTRPRSSTPRSTSSTATCSAPSRRTEHAVSEILMPSLADSMTEGTIVLKQARRRRRSAGEVDRKARPETEETGRLG